MNTEYQDAVKAVQSHALRQPQRLIRNLVGEPDRLSKFALDLPGMYIDMTRSPVNASDWSALLNLAKASQIEARRDGMFEGQIMNPTEGRKVWHTLLRAEHAPQVRTSAFGEQQLRQAQAEADAAFVQVQSTLNKMRAFCQRIQASGVFTDIVHIGIGGSYLGPELVCQALQNQSPGQSALKVHFVANVDPYAWDHLARRLDPAKTLIILASKSWTTQETTLNAQALREWYAAAGMDETHVAKHWVAVTAKPELAKKDGLSDEQIFPFADWVGGRFSLWSAIGLPIMLSCGIQVFDSLLAGARAMDQHFRQAPLEANAPVMLALLSLWHQMHLHAQSEAVIPYAQRLARLPAFLQQLQMESNGKRVDLQGHPLSLPSAPVVWGEPGTDSQHSFFQALHHSPQIQSIEFVLVAEQARGDRGLCLLSNALAQIEALSLGQASDDPHRNYPGNRPCMVILLKSLDAQSLGMLLALYEHKTASLGWLLNINSFDQFGVELGKVIAKQFEPLIRSKQSTIPADTSAATRALIEKLRPD